MLYTPKCNSLLFASPVTYKNVASSQGSYAALTSHSVSFKMGTIRGFICAKYTIAHLRMHNTECQHFDNNGFTQREQRFHDIWLTRAMALQLKSKLVTRIWEQDNSSYLTRENKHEALQLLVFVYTCIFSKGSSMRRKSFLSSFHHYMSRT